MKKARGLFIFRFFILPFSVVFFVFFSIPFTFAAVTISNVSPNNINSPNDIITVTASASGLQNSTQYFQILLTKEGEANYFGLTKNTKDEWNQYKSSPSYSDLSSYFFSFTPINGFWSGDILAKIDLSDTGYKGPGNYVIKLAKYITSSASFSTNTMTVAVNIVLTPTPTLAPTPTEVPTPTKTPTLIPTSTPAKTPTPVPTLLSSPTPTYKMMPSAMKEKPSSREDATLGDNTQRPQVQSISPTNSPQRYKDSFKNTQNYTPFIFIGVGIILLLVCGILTFWPQINSLWKK